MQMVKEKQDLTYLSWSVYRNSSGTAGSFLKAYSELGGKKTYYKLSNFDKARGVIGHECVNELIVDRLLTILGIPHLSYQLIHADVSVDGKTHEVYLCASEDFKAKSESRLLWMPTKSWKHCRMSPLWISASVWDGNIMSIRC